MSARLRPTMSATVLIAAASACVGSVNPVYTDDAPVEDSTLVGTWMAASGDVLKVTAGPGPAYDVAMVDQDGAVSRWVAHLTRIAGLVWVDVEPEELPAGWADNYRGAFLPLHQFWVLRGADSLLLVAGIDADSLRALLAREPDAIAHAHVGSEAGWTVITASTADLRTFLTALAARPGFIEENDEPMRRVR